MLGEDKELQQEFQQLVKGEIELFKAIAKGEGVSKSQHTGHDLEQDLEDKVLYSLYYRDASVSVSSVQQDFSLMCNSPQISTWRTCTTTTYMAAPITGKNSANQW